MVLEQNTRTGLRGEKSFDLLCTEAGLICNPSREDDAGWDFFVQFDLDNHFDGPSDKRPPAMSAFFQVKTSIKLKTNVSIKISNAERMITESRPFFFVFGLSKKHQMHPGVSFKTGHVGKEAINHISKLLRENYVLPKKKRRLKVSIPFSILEIDTVNQASDIAEIIRKHAKGDIEKYIAQKIATRKSVGYEAAAYKGRFTLEGENAERDLISVMIGERDSIAVKNFIVSETRFQIEAIVEKLETVTIRLMPTFKRYCLVVFYDSKNDISCEFECEFRASFIKDLPIEEMKIRIHHDYFAFTVGYQSDFENWQFQPSWSGHLPWSVSRELATLIALLSSGFCIIQCFLDGEEFAAGSFQVEKPKKLSFHDFEAARTSLDMLCRDPSRRHKIRFSANEFQAYLKTHRLIYHALSAGVGSKVTISTDIASPPAHKPRTTFFILPLIFACDGKLVSCCIIAEGQASMSGGKLRLTPTKIKIGPLEKFDNKVGAILFQKSFAMEFAEKGDEQDFLVIEESIMPNGNSKPHLLGLNSKEL